MLQISKALDKSYRELLTFLGEYEDLEHTTLKENADAYRAWLKECGKDDLPDDMNIIVTALWGCVRFQDIPWWSQAVVLPTLPTWEKMRARIRANIDGTSILRTLMSARPGDLVTVCCLLFLAENREQVHVSETEVSQGDLFQHLADLETTQEEDEAC